MLDQASHLKDTAQSPVTSKLGGPLCLLQKTDYSRHYGPIVQNQGVSILRCNLPEHLRAKMQHSHYVSSLSASLNLEPVI